MKKMFLTGFLCAALGLSLQAENRIFEQTFGKDALRDWEQNQSAHFRPPGKVLATEKGLALQAGKAPIHLFTKKFYPVCAGDIVTLTLDFETRTGGSFSLGIYRFHRGNWIGNDMTTFYVKPGETTASRSVTVKSARDRKTRDMRIVIGFSGKDSEAVLKKIKASFSGVDLKCSDKQPLPPGIILHYDMSRVSSLDAADGKIKRCTDLSGNGNDAVSVPGREPTLAGNDASFAGKNSARFFGKQEMRSLRNLNAENGITTFVVFRRRAEEGKGEMWQDSLYWGDGKHSDNTARYHQHMGENRNEEPPAIFFNASSFPASYPMRIGSNGGFRGFLWGDIGEILVFGRTDLTARETEQVRSHLLKKWRIEENDFTRIGPLPQGPRPVTRAYPLSDQTNKGNWRAVPELTDEFDGPVLDRSKWTDQNYWTLGSSSTRILPENLVLKDGMIRIVSKYDRNMPSGRLYPRDMEYHSFSTGTLKSLHLIRYGYFEARIKMQATTLNNAFWLFANATEKKTGRRAEPEIDIFEVGPRSFRGSRNYNMTLHSIERHPERKHYNFGKSWTSNFDFAADFHVYGLEWSPKFIRWYIDGVLVRQFKVERNFWNMPMQLHFDVLNAYGWMGVPNPKDFPAEMEIDYCRVWKNPETTVPDDKWEEEFDTRHLLPRNTGFAYDYYRKHGAEIVSIATPKESGPFESFNLCDVSSPAVRGTIQCVNNAKSATTRTKDGKEIPEIFLPHVAALKDNGEVQYVIQPVEWPAVIFPAKALSSVQWEKFQYFALDFVNDAGRPLGITVTVQLENNAKEENVMLIKEGAGTCYWRLSDSIRKGKIRNIKITTVRSCDHDFKLGIANLRLEK